MKNNLEYVSLKKIFNNLLYLRLFEKILSEEYHPADEMKCPVHFCIGQEGVPSILKFFLKKNDYVFSHHRSHGYFFSKSIPMQKLVSELYGKKYGANYGFAGSQDVSYPKKKFYAGAILGGSIGIAVGKALDEKLKKSKNIVIAGFGESACDVGMFWESINYANLKKLPIIFVCENNNYSVLSPQKARQSGKKLFQKVSQFSNQNNTISVDGNDVIKMKKVFNNVINKVRNNHGPFFIEARTYRISGHVGPETDDAQDYRSKAEVNKWKKKCPIKKLEKYLLDNKFINNTYSKNLEHKFKLEIRKMIKFAQKDKFISKINLERANYDFTKFRNKKIKTLRPYNYKINISKKTIVGY